MSEIIKLYKNAGIEPERQDCCKVADKYWAYDTEKGFEYLMQKECPHNQECTDECEYAYDKIIYPPFTAEKQIEIVCFLINKGVELSFKCEQGKINTQAIQRSLAGVINKLWQSLTDQEKEEIRGILNE